MASHSHEVPPYPPSGGAVVPADWFETPALTHWLITLPAVAFMEVLCLAPENLPTSYMGPLGRFLDNLIEKHPVAIFRFLMAGNFVHMLEGLYALRLSRKMRLNNWTTFKWTIQTTVFGIVSLLLIKRKASELPKRA